MGFNLILITFRMPKWSSKKFVYFLINANDLIKILGDTDIIMFADDTIITVCGNNLIDSSIE